MPMKHVVLLAIPLLLVPHALPADSAHTVEVKVDSVRKNCVIDYNDEERTTCDAVEYLGPDRLVRVASKTFRPPPGFLFVLFADSDTHVDIWNNPEGFDYERLIDEPTDVRVRGTFMPAINAGEYPLRCEGNLKAHRPDSGGGGGGGGGGGSGGVPSEPKRFHWSAKVDVESESENAIDLDIDSDNNGGVYGGPDRTDEEDAIEESALGKYIPRNDGDEDNDQLESFADGFGLPGTPGSDASAGTRFVPLVLDISRAGEIDWATARLKVDYSTSPPGGVTTHSLPGAPAKTYHLPAPGMLRLWTTNAASRNVAAPPGGHYLAPGEYAVSALFSTGVSNATWYVEGIGQGMVTGLVAVALKPNDTAGWLGDKIFCSVVHGDIDVDSDNNNTTALPPHRIKTATRTASRPPPRLTAAPAMANCLP